LYYKFVPLDHPSAGSGSFSAASTNTEKTSTETPPSAAVSLQLEPKTIDLHTTCALIGRDELDITLEQLGLQHETVGGVLDLYAVIRPLPNKSDHLGKAEDEYIGKDAAFRADKSWVCSCFDIAN
jgi:hypothetical protein